MKKILLIGKLNEVLKNVDQTLSKHFHVQICDLRKDTVEGMLKVVEPSLVIISLVGADTPDMNLFITLSKDYTRTPVLTIGTDAEMKIFSKYYDRRQFENLTRPLSNSDLLSAVCRRLDMMCTEKNGSVVVSDAGTKKNVLVVDDNPVTIRAIKGMLENDFAVTIATSGAQAMTAIGKRRPDCILLDYEMPVCDGRQTLEMIRADEELSSIPVIFLTAVRDKEHIEKVLSLRPQGYLLKPSSKDNLIAKINEVI
ncbi:MAG: response regulator [Lachnospiraceae bacterium]|nr:response regulator [Lachnospiraceae bacterium]